MGANHSPKDTFIYFPFKLTPFEETQILMQFDMNCEMDVQEIKELNKEKKYIKRVCVYKILISPFESLLTFVLFGTEEFKYKTKMTSLYWKFFRNKITLEKFGKEIAHLLQSGKVI